MASVELRPARPEDAARLHELHTASVRTLCAPHYPPEVIDGWLSDRQPQGYLPPIKRGVLFVAERDDAIIGFGEASAGTVVAVYVDPQAAGHGVGSALLKHALQVARREHDGAVSVESTLNARGFYARHGFREIGGSTVRRGAVEVSIIRMELRSDRETQTVRPPLRR